MNTVVSKDGTKIAYDKIGDGPAVILVAGAMSARLSWSGPELAKLLAPHYTVYNYDRRGRGESGDVQPYAVDREIEDIEALIDEAGEAAFLFGHSSGASLVLDAALKLGSKVKKIALYEAPYNNDPEAQRSWGKYLQDLSEALAASRRGDAIALFMRYVGTPAADVEGMRHAPFWASLEALAPTLAYDHAAIQGKSNAIPADRAAHLTIPALVMYGGASFPFMETTARTLSQAMPHARLQSLAGQTHNVNMEVLAPVLLEFFSQ